MFSFVDSTKKRVFSTSGCVLLHKCTLTQVHYMSDLETRFLWNIEMLMNMEFFIDFYYTETFYRISLRPEDYFVV